MTRSRRLKPLVRLAEVHEQESARRLGESQSDLREQESRLREMADYRKEYSQRVNRAGEKGLDARNLLAYQSFLGQLNQAIEQLEGQVEQARDQVDRNRSQWMQRRGRQSALQSVVERSRQNEQRELGLAEQKESDDHAQRPGAPSK